MARFAFDSVPTVAPTGPSGSQYEDIHATPEEFGGLKARAEQTLGQGIEHVAEAGFTVDAFHNKVASDSGTTNVIDGTEKLLYGDPSKPLPDGSPDLGYFGTKGADALRNRETTMKAIQDLRESERNKLPPGAQLEFDRETRRRYADAEGRVGAHATQQQLTWAADVNQKGSSVALTSFVNSGFSEDDARRFINFRVKEVQAKYGSDPTLTQAAVEDANRDLLKAHTDAIAVKDAPAAMKLLEENRKVAGTQYDDMYRGLEARANKQLGDRAGAEALGKARTGTPSNFETPQGIPRIAPRLVSQAETGDPNLGPRALGNISRDAGGTKSYGFTGLNSGSGSLAQFTREYGAQFGLRGALGSPGFDAQWHAASTDQTKEFRDAQLKFFADHDVATVRRDLRSVGIPENITGDPRVMTYFADRHVQMGNLGLSQAGFAWDRANGDVPTFLRNMTAIDGRPENLQSNFRTAIATGVYGPAGHATRLRTRLNGALAAGSEEGDGGDGGASELAPASFVQGQTAPQGPAEPVGAGGSSQTQRVMLSQPTVAASTRPGAMQQLIDNPELKNNPEAFARAETVVHQQLQAEEIAENQGTKARNENKEIAASTYVSDINAARHGQGDLVAIAGKINSDPNLAADPHLKQWLIDLATKGSREEQEIGFGPGYRDAIQGILTGRTKFSDLTAREDITTAGLEDIRKRVSLTKGDVDRHAIEMKINSFLRGAKRDLSFEQIDGPVKIMDPKGEQIFNYQFEPEFVSRASALADEAQKTGDHSKLDKFLSSDNVKKMVREYRNPQDMAADKMRANAGVSGEGASAAIPMAPEGVNEAAWTEAMQAPPKLVTGATPSRAQWGQAVETLMSNPSPQMVALFQKYHPGVDAMTLLEKINPAAATAAKMTGGIQPEPETKEPAPAAAPAPAAPPATKPPPTEAELHPEAPSPREERTKARAAEQTKVEEQQRKDREQWEADRAAGMKEAETARQSYEQHLSEAKTRRGERRAAEPQKRAEEARKNYVEVLKDREKHLLGAPGDVITPAIKRELEDTRAKLKALER